MKKQTFILIISFFIVTISYSNLWGQNIYFCEDITDDGQPVNESNSFTIGPKGGYLYFLVRLPYKVGCTYINYVFYDIDDDGNASYNTTITQDNIDPEWNWFYKAITFFKEGRYKIMVKDCNSYLLTTGYIKIKVNPY